MSRLRPLVRTLGARQLGFNMSGSAGDAIPMYWWEGFYAPADSFRLLRKGQRPFVYNFGDMVSPMIVSLLANRATAYTSGSNKFLALGSVFFALQDGDTVWGSGLIKTEHLSFVRQARAVNYLAVRGPKTRAALRSAGIECPEVYGDPAMLLPHLVRNDIEPRWPVGVVPHWSQTDEFLRALGNNSSVRVIDVRKPFDDVIREILACRLILATSMHGLIIPEAYGIPSLLVVYRQPIRGDLHKWEDYFQSTNRDLVMRRIERCEDIVNLADVAATAPLPSFDPTPLVRAFPYRAPNAPLPPPSRAWSTLRWQDFSCFGRRTYLRAA